MNDSRPLCLVGLRGAGKSSAGARLATALARPFVDLDRVVEGKAGSTIRALFSDHGEGAFRALECEALRETLRLVPNAIVATGGGVVLRAENRGALEDAFVVYLSGAPAVLAARVAADPASGDDRPALALGGPQAEATRLLAERDPFYREVADVIVDANQPLEDVVEAVLAAIR